MTICSRCKEDKPKDEFFKQTKRPSGIQVHCKVCSREVTQEWRAAHPERTKELNKRYYDKTGLSNHRRRAYGLSPEEVQVMEKRQESRCALCGLQATPLHVDHDHETGLVRELLCRGCNHGLGNFLDNTDLLRKAIDYLERHRISTLALDSPDV
jgi:hypothetical protein